MAGVDSRILVGFPPDSPGSNRCPRGQVTCGLVQLALLGASPGMAEQTGFTVDVWVWKDRYGGLRADWASTQPDASVCQVQLPAERGPLQRLYGNITRVIAEREATSQPVHTGRASLGVRVWETCVGRLVAGLVRRKGATVIHLALPADLDQLQKWHDRVVGQTEARGIPHQAWVKRPGARVVSVVTTKPISRSRAGPVCLRRTPRARQTTVGRARYGQRPPSPTRTPASRSTVPAWTQKTSRRGSPPSVFRWARTAVVGPREGWGWPASPNDRYNAAWPSLVVAVGVRGRRVWASR